MTLQLVTTDTTRPAPTTGHAIVGEIFELLNARLPALDLDDPLRPALLRIRAALAEHYESRTKRYPHGST